MKERMSRGLSQSLYKYLPESWIDFSARGKERRNYIAKVLRWNSEQLDGINKKRLIRTVNNIIDTYRSQPYSNVAVPPTSGFGDALTVENCLVLSPKSTEEERGIVAGISPLTFYCKNCNKVYQFKSEYEYKLHSRCTKCNIPLTQFRQVYFCQCGWASDEHPVYCSNCKSDHYIKWNGRYDFICMRCGKKIPMMKKCDNCGRMVYPKTALDPSQYVTQSTNIIDLIDEKMENFITDQDYGAYVIVAFWFGFISFDELKIIIRDGMVNDEDEYNRVYTEEYEMFINVLDENGAKVAARVSADKKCKRQYKDKIDSVKTLLSSTSNLKSLAEMILEYTMAINTDEKSTLEEAIDIAFQLNTNANPESYQSIAKTYGISFTQVCGHIPFVMCSYGYMRDKFQYEDGVQLRAFPPERADKKNIYASKLNTECVVFEFDRVKILKWLFNNGYVAKEDLPSLDDEVGVKAWFLNNIKLDLIKPFSEIDENTSSHTFYVYRLIHSLSHLLIRSASEICGLDKNSISEYIFPAVPAVMIYCQNSQGFNLGALFNVFEAYFDRWIDTAAHKAEKCIFDPICIDRDKACTGCLFLNEISCQHFNKDLDRSLVVGHIDKVNNKRMYGFWEDSING